MLDDFFLIGPKHSQKCLQDLNKFIYMCEESGTPIKMEKKNNLRLILSHPKSITISHRSFKLYMLSCRSREGLFVGVL